MKIFIQTCSTRFLLQLENKSSLIKLPTMKASNHQVDELKWKIKQYRTFSALKLCPIDQQILLEKNAFLCRSKFGLRILKQAGSQHSLLILSFRALDSSNVIVLHSI